ncbi:FecR family protein [Hymenobacter tenuis]
MTQEEFNALLQRYLDGNSQLGERQLVEGWSEQLGLQENLVLPEFQHEEVRAAMWEQIRLLTGDGESQVVETPVISRPASFWLSPALRWVAAALLVLGVGLGIWQTMLPHSAGQEWTRHVNEGRQLQVLTLADGSQVTLHPGSSLRYAAGLLCSRREVQLTGQAYFKVAKNPARPFLVFTDHVVTTVLGTSFMVTSYADKDPTVAVREGRVAVQQRSGANLAATPGQPVPGGIVLEPNQQVVYSRSGHILRKELVANPLMLTSQPLAFRNRPVAEVLVALENAYGVNIVYDPRKLEGCSVTIAFDNEPLFEQLDMLCTILNTQYKKADDAQIIFESSGCQI